MEQHLESEHNQKFYDRKEVIKAWEYYRETQLLAHALSNWKT